MDLLYHDSVGCTIDKYGNDNLFGIVNRNSDGYGANIHVDLLDNITNGLVSYVKELGENERGSSRKMSSVVAKNSPKANDKKITLLELEVWSLLCKLGSSKLLKDIDNDECQSALKEAVANMGDDDSFETCLYSIYSADARVLKMKLLQEWLEDASRYRNNSSINIIDFNNSETIASYEQSLVRNVNNANNIADKEVLIKLIWQYLRGGMYIEAQRLSSLYETYCLGTSLGFLMPLCAPLAGNVADRLDSSMGFMDANDSFVSIEASDDYKRSTEVLKVSAIRQPVKMHSCFKYVNHLSSSSAAAFPSDSGTAMDSVAVEYEKVIIALLSSNLTFLLSSPFLSEWSDKLYVVVKALHETSLMKSMHQHKMQKLRSSRLHSDCREEVLRAEEGILASVGLLDDIEKTADMKAILKSRKLLLSDSTSTSAFYRIEPFFTDMQIHIIEGHSSIQLFVDTQVAAFYASTYKLYKQQSPDEEFASIVRTLCHFLIWCRYAEYDIVNVPINDESAVRGDPVLMNHVFPDELLYASVQMHIGLLINERKFDIVPAYAAYLSKSRRVAMYVQLFESFLLQSSNVSSHVSSASYSNFIQHNALLDVSRALVHSSRYFLVDFSDVMFTLLNNQIERKRQQVVATSASSKSGSTWDFIDLHDLRLVQLLHVFFVHERFLEGVKVANSLMTLFLLENSSSSAALTSSNGSYNNIANVKLVLSTLPPNAVLGGNNAINNCIVRNDSLVGFDSTASAENQLIINVWNTNLHILNFFESYRSVNGLYVDWQNCTNAIVVSNDSSNKYMMTSADFAAISEKASHVISALLSLLNPIFLQYNSRTSDTSDVFSMLAALTYQQMNLMIGKLLLVERSEFGSKEAGQQNLPLYDGLLSMYERAIASNPIFDKTNKLNLQSLASDDSTLSSSERSRQDSGITAATLHTLRGDLFDCSNYTIVLKSILYDILSKHNYVCFQTAALLLKNAGSGLNSHVKSSIMYWYSRVANVVTFISKEGGSESSSIYRILDAAMIDALLRDVLSANIQLLNLQAV